MLSVRRATCQTDSSGGIQMNFYPRPPRGGRLGGSLVITSSLIISIHALREEGDPARFSAQWCYPAISIHALREEGDFQ